MRIQVDNKTPISKLKQQIKNCKFNWKDMCIEFPENRYNNKILDLYHSEYKTTNILLDHQQDGLKFIKDTLGRCILGFQMGLGKSLTALSFCELYPIESVLIVCPAFLRNNWYEEIMKWSDKFKIIESDISIIYNLDDLLCITHKYNIISYNFIGMLLQDKYLRTFEKVLNNYIVDCMILDECHKINDMKTKQSLSTHLLGGEIPFIIGLSGTPFMNRPIELFSILKLLDKESFKNKISFGMKYCNGKKNIWGGYDFKGASNLDELKSKVQHYIIRKTKDDTTLKLPEKNIYFINVKDDKYDLDLEDISFETLELHRQLCADIKLPYALDWIDNFIEENTNQLVVFCYHRKICEAIHNTYKDNACLIYGDLSEDKKNIQLKEFTNGNKQILVGNINTIGLGLNLCQATYGLFVEIVYNPMLLFQCESRLLRIGQKNTVFIYYMKLLNSIDTIIYKMLQNKRKIFEQVFSKENKEWDKISHLSFSKELLEYIKNVKLQSNKSIQ